MVRFFNRPRKAAAKRTAAQTTNGTDANPAPPDVETTPASPAAKKTTRTATTRRRTTTRPPRRDWAAEAAALPIGAPSPQASSTASAPTEVDEEKPSPPTKRRRGTRGGRGRKKKTEGAGAEIEEAAAEETPQTIEALVARQTQALESFTKEVTGTIRDLQATVADLQAQVARRAVQTARARVGIFVDVPNVIYAAERRNLNIDFGKVLEYFTRDRELVRASAYAPITDDPQAKLENQRFVHHFLGHPYRIITKPLKRFADGSMKANFDIELAIDILTMSDRLDVVVLMSGDGDFRRLVELIASRGVRVEVAAFGETASNELKVVADRYVDLADLINELKSGR